MAWLRAQNFGSAEKDIHLDVPWTEEVCESLTWLLSWKILCYVMYNGSRKLYWIRLYVNLLLCLQVVNASAHLAWWSTSRIILLNNSFRFKNLEANKWPKQSKTFFFSWSSHHMSEFGAVFVLYEWEFFILPLIW